jgi:peroxiredoxin
MWKALVFLLASLPLWGQGEHPILALGAPAPDFALPGVDGKIHKLSDYSASQVLVVVFTCDHCEIAQQYERRIEQLATDYRNRGVAVVAIQPNDPRAIRIDELADSDVSDSLAEMKVRVQYKHLVYPYLYDGETQQVARAYGPQATPHVFIFDHERRLRYEGRIDDNYRAEMVKTQYARNAIGALLENREVQLKHTAAFGCSTKWQEKEASATEALRKIEAQPVLLEMASAADLRTLRANASGRMMLVTFWATWCTSCLVEFPDLQDTYRMYSIRDLALVTVSVNMPDEKPSVMRLLQKMHATSRNLLFASDDTAALQAAFDPKWTSAVPYTVLLAPDGKVLYQKQGDVDISELRRKILANLPTDYIGFAKYWTEQ